MLPDQPPAEQQRPGPDGEQRHRRRPEELGQYRIAGMRPQRPLPDVAAGELRGRVAAAAATIPLPMAAANQPGPSRPRSLPFASSGWSRTCTDGLGDASDSSPPTISDGDRPTGQTAPDSSRDAAETVGPSAPLTLWRSTAPATEQHAP
ncbi:hypothetical protein [Streptomyces sp. NPDC002763]|uniref:hypothetical protein n=1 Tax=Streptomyces sp. NPDC002763 TaxID=3154427 RepID=UPI00332CDB8D